MDACKAPRVKIKAYGERYGRFGGLSSSTNVEGCKTS